MKPRISIIVPIYNMEQYLERCLDSLLNQNLKDIEIIAVNDGSTDGTGIILSKYSLKDNRIIVVNKENGGVSSARNTGLKLASGKYIGFVDPDDWVNKDMYGLLLDTAENDHADIVMCSYMREFGTHSKEKDFHFPKKVKYENDEVKNEVMRRLIGPLKEEIANPELLDAWGTVWNKVYRADLIQKHNLEFVDLVDIGTNEDSLFNIEVLANAKSFVFINKPLYHYWRGNTSSVTSTYKPNLKEQWLELYQRIHSIIVKNKLPKEVEVALNNRICLNTLGIGINTVSKANEAPTSRKVQKVSLFLNEEIIKESFTKLEMNYFPLVWRIFYSLAKTRSAIGFYFMLISIEYLRKTLK